MLRRLLTIGVIVAALPGGAAAQAFQPGDDVLIQDGGHMVIAWVVAQAPGDRSIVATTWNSRSMRILPNQEIKPSRGLKRPPEKKVITGWTAHQPGLYRLDTAATGGLMVAASHGGLTQVFRQDVLIPITEIPRKARADGVAISPDSRRLAMCDHAGTLSVYDLPGGKLLRTTKVGTGCRYLTFGPGGLLAMETREGKMGIRLYSADTGALSALQMPITESGQVRTALRLSPDGKWLVDARDTTKPFRGKRGVRVYAVNGLALTLTRILVGPQDVASVAISRDGRFVAGGGRENMAMLWDLHTGRLVWQKTLPYQYLQVDLSSTGSSLAVCGRGGTSSVHILDSRDGGTQAQLGSQQSDCAMVRFTGDGRVVYTSRNLHSNFGETAVHRFLVP